MAGLLFGIVLSMQAVVVTYQPDNTTIFPNPERGFTEELSRKVSLKNPNVIKGHTNEGQWFKGGDKDNMRLAVVLYNFTYFKDQDLAEEILTGFDEDMQELREVGWKCVLRFAYTETTSDNVDATPEWVKRHLEQLKPHLAKNADVIYVLEAGFIGVWGEWYYTKNYGDQSQHMNDNRRKVIDYLFENVPSDRFILFRYPMIKTEYLNDTKPLTAEEGFNGSVKARMGCHNDAFLNSWGNDGTYASNKKDDDPDVREYVSVETHFVPNGGETNVESNSLAEKVYSQAPSEMSTYHWSFCGKSYATQVTSKWRSSGIFDTLNIHMGYRYNLLDGQFTDAAAPSGKANITIRILNSGYAPIYNERTAYIVLKSESKTYSLPLQSDPRRWSPNNAISAINEQVAIPADIPEGKYHLYLYLPDKYASLAADPRFAVRIANEGIWDSESGMNDLKAEINISASASLDPGPLPEVETQGIGMVSNQSDSAQPHKMLENGIFYILMPNGKRYYCL